MSQQTPSPSYTIVRSYAGHSTRNGSDKVWAACLVEKVSDTSSADGRDWLYLAVWGKRGASLSGGAPGDLESRAAAEARYATKTSEKVKEGYTRIDVAPFLSSFKIPLRLPEQESDLSAASPSLVVPGSDRPPVFASTHSCTSVVTAISWEQVQRGLEGHTFGITEKVNGERCLLVYDGTQFRAYNRRGVLQSTPPESASSLSRLGIPIVLDGERLTGPRAGDYVVFDLLAYQEQDCRSWPYQQRISTLERLLQEAQIIRGGAPTEQHARAQSVTPGLCLLFPATGPTMKETIKDVQDAAGEGLILRVLSAPYEQTRAVRKYKFTADLDGIVIGHVPGTAEGSLEIGLVRPSDGALIGVCKVRSGLTDADIRVLRDRRARGEWPVLTIEYLPIRTTGIHLVEPCVTQQRTDKQAWACTTEQLGDEKAALVSAALPHAATAGSSQSQVAMKDVASPSETPVQRDPAENRGQEETPAGQEQEARQEAPPSVQVPLGKVALCLIDSSKETESLATLRDLLTRLPGTLVIDLRPTTPSEQKRLTGGKAAFSRAALRHLLGFKYWDRAATIRTGTIYTGTNRFSVRVSAASIDDPLGVPFLLTYLQQGYSMILLSQVRDGRGEAVLDALRTRLPELQRAEDQPVR
ncbi:MAG: RNA ligase family protein [Ktedonobacteraceae bacterium]